MRRMLILLVMAMVLLVGCGKDPQPADSKISSSPTGSEGSVDSPDTPDKNNDPIVDPDKACYDVFTGNEVWGENYALYHGNDGQLMLFDAASGLCLPYCFDASCPHDKHGYTSPGGERVACISYDFPMTTFSLRDDGSYFYDNYKGTLYRADREGRNRKEIARVTDPVNTATGIFAHYYTKDDLFFTYVSNYEVLPMEGSDGPIPGEWIMGDQLEKNEAGIYRINLNDGTTSYLYRMNEYNSLVSYMHEENGHLFFVTTWLDVPFDTLPDGFTDYAAYEAALAEHKYLAVYDYDLAAGELRQVALIEKTVAQVYFGDGFYVVTYGLEDIPAELYRTSGEKIRDLDFSISLCPSMHSDRYLYYQRYVMGAGTYTYGIYDIAENAVVKEITLDETIAPGPWAAAVGDAYYFQGNHTYYVKAEDLWNGDMSKRIELRSN